MSFSYQKVIGTAFQPRTSATTFSFGSFGCSYHTGGLDTRFQAPLILPDDSIIKYVRIYYLDTSASDMTVSLSRYVPGQLSEDLISVDSSGAAGYGSQLSPELNITVDNATYAYVLSWTPGASGNTQQLCGVRVAYYSPFVPAATACSLDVDGNGTFDALTDGLIILRALFGLTGTAVTNGAIGGGTPTRTTWAQLQPYLNGNCGTNFAM